MHHRRPLLPPLPGTDALPRGLFVSRWGALLERPRGGVCRRLEQASFRPHALELLFRASQAGWRLYLVGNEPAVAQGRLPQAQWEHFDAELQAHLTGQGIRVQRHYACLDHPRGRPPHRRDSVYRFPNTGAFYHALHNDGLDLRESWLLSADVDELVAGWRAGLRTCALGWKSTRTEEERQAEPTRNAGSLAEALLELLTEESARA